MKFIPLELRSRKQIAAYLAKHAPRPKTFKGNKHINRYARRMRRNPTEAESLLARKCEAIGYVPHIQKVIGYRIVDIYIPSIDVSIEADGAQHYTKEGIINDGERAAELKRARPQMITLRYSNYEILYGQDFTHKLKESLDGIKATRGLN